MEPPSEKPSPPLGLSQWGYETLQLTGQFLDQAATAKQPVAALAGSRMASINSKPEAADCTPSLGHVLKQKVQPKAHWNGKIFTA